MDKKGQYMKIGLKDLTNGPYIKCPKCGKNSFAVLMICDHHYIRRCVECYHPQGHEPPARYSLPKLNKKVIYIDQFAISNMMKFLNPSTKGHKKVRGDPFWGRLFERLDTLCKLQLLICPDSDFHRNESLLAPFYGPLERIYELLSRGVSFYNHETIHRFQILGQLEIWLGETKTLDLDVHQITYRNIDAWTGKFIVSLNIKNSQELIDELRTNREKVADHLEGVFRRWQSEKDKDFYYWYNEERKAAAYVLIKSYEEYLKNFVSVHLGLAPFQLGAILGNMAVDTFHDIKEYLKEKQIEETDLDKKLVEFLCSEVFEDTPHIKISSMLCAAMARKAAAGRKNLPTRGFWTDVHIVSTLLPYCDAMFIDNECRSFLAERPLCYEIDYGTKVFSYANRGEFIDYLDGIESTASKRHLKRIEEVYGPNWRQPFWKIFNH